MNKNLLRILPVLGALIALTIIPASAQTTGVTASATSTRAGRIAASEAKLVAKADQEITARINALNALNTRVNSMVKVSTTEKASLSSAIQTEITDMNTLQAQIASDQSSNSTSSLKTDLQSITKSYRIYALIIPQGAIEAMADRVMTIVGDIDAVATKLQARISSAPASENMTAATAELADLNAKTADANTQAQAAVSGISGLQPDNGVQSVMQSNTAALKAARADLQTAQKDLIAARKDAGLIVKAIEAASKPTTGSTATSS